MRLILPLIAFIGTLSLTTAKETILAYWDYGSCGPDGDDANWEWCRWTKGVCLEWVKTSKCSSGVAKLIDVKKNFKQNGCEFFYGARYSCSENEKGPDKENENKGGKPGGKPVKEIKASSGGNSNTVTPSLPTPILCTASCAKEFQRCHNHHNKGKGKTCAKAFDQCRGEIDKGDHRLVNAGCTKKCTSTDDMLKLETCA